MTKEFDAYCKTVIATLSTIKREPLAGKPDDLVEPKLDKPNGGSKTDKNADFEDFSKGKAADPKPAPAAKNGDGKVASTVKPGSLVDTETFAKTEKAKEGEVLKGKGGKTEVATAYKAGKMVG